MISNWVSVLNEKRKTIVLGNLGDVIAVREQIKKVLKSIDPAHF